jgi:hypothetical protein
MNKRAQRVWDFIEKNQDSLTEELKHEMAKLFDISIEMAISAIFRWGLNDRDWFDQNIK